MNNMKKILTICLLSIATNLMATEKDSVVTKSLDEVSVTSLYRNSVVTGSSLSREKLVSENHGQGPDYVFSKLPGIYAYNDNGLHMGYTYFRIRGMGQERMNVTLDGMPWNEAEDFGCYFSNSPDLMGSMQSIKALIEAGLSPEIILQIRTVEQIKSAAEVQSGLLEKLNLSDVTILGDSKTVGDFITQTTTGISPALEKLRSLPLTKATEVIEDK